jgi:PKD repeat protein
LFISEYIEGSSNNKGLEIYNPTSNTVDLSNYEIQKYSNGSATATDTFQMYGSLAPGGVFVIVANQADPIMLGKADTAVAWPSVVHHNGDDAISLINTTMNDTLDIIGEIGVDPGSEWIVGSGSTKDNTLVRKKNVNEGTTDWSLSATQWEVFPRNTYDSLGAHTMTPCGAVIDPEVFFVSSSQDEDESVGSFQVMIGITNPNGNDTEVEVYVKGGTAINGTDYTFTDPTKVTFPANSPSPQSVTITIIDDTDLEQDETIILGLRNPSNNASIGLDSTTITILDNDKPIPLYKIQQVRGVDVDGVADSLGVLCELRGVVMGVNLRPSGLSFYMHDKTAGINIFSFSSQYGYTVVEGDSIHVIGTIAQFRGLTEIMPDTVIFISAGNALQPVTMVSMLDESTESELVELCGYWMVDTSEWGSSSFGFNLRVTNGIDTLIVRIDNDVDIFNESVPTDSILNWTGIGSQYSSSSSGPFTDGYQLFPRYKADMVPTMEPIADWSYTTTTLTVDFKDSSTSDCSTTYNWDFGDGNTSALENPSHTYTVKGVYYVCLTVTNIAGSSTKCDTIVVGPVGFSDPINNSNYSIYPIPSSGMLFMESDQPIVRYELMTLSGKLVQFDNVNDLKTQTDLSALPNGLYLVKLYFDDYMIIKRIVKQ